MRTCVFFHAHPDDEALLTAGLMARLADAGHRVVLVVATAGERGRTGLPTVSLGPLRLRELEESARVLGCARVVPLGYPDSGLDGGAPGGFASRPVAEPAGRLAAILREEDADLLTVYDEHGGYGHPDHVQVHRVGVEAARLAGTRVVLEATVDRDRLWRWLRPLSKVLPLDGWRQAYTPGSRISHRVDVRRYAAAKRAAMAAHASQGSGGPRLLAVLRRLPDPVFRHALGTEYYVRR
ncbi:PIG-L family deacetylase [Actinocorallia sp. API 0066]|uniref:PIG-L deacetylase family protein n=1 Tax=Actinocorallia sp. API 0066 TaxID=2896846 RepID=UPI001E624827|nr:PIG-L family deacetylase [Actinocorallia sp. API 0066]MCD0450553.1 PIG-L family deacetylase [Actinocorallia sp. API 0066]